MRFESKVYTMNDANFFFFINKKELMHEKGVCARIEEEHREEAPEA